VLGICGGLQMLGRTLRDPSGVESGGPAEADGLGLLDLHTTWSARKATTARAVRDRVSGLLLRGYEIHHGRTTAGPGVDETIPGLAWRGGNVAGTYLHGLFDNPGYLARFCAEAGLHPPVPVDDLPARLESLGDAVRRHLDWPAIQALIAR
jgi:adenosylcobyric acid synthase